MNSFDGWRRGHNRCEGEFAEFRGGISQVDILEPVSIHSIPGGVRKQGNARDANRGFAVCDWKRKCAADMCLAGSPLKQVQALCRPKSIATTQICLKSRRSGTIEPDRRVVGV
jgi:hypothetical protein